MDSSDRRGISGRIGELALYIVVAVGLIMILIGLHECHQRVDSGQGSAA